MTTSERFCAAALNFTSSQEAVKEVSIGKEGRIKFKIPCQSFFKQDQELKKIITANSDFESTESFYIDVAGSLLVRKHLHVFIKFLNILDEEDYNEKLLLYNHLHFSVQKINESLEWTFHVSFLHDVILSNFVSSVERENV